MNSLKNLQGEKITNLFGGKGLEKTLNWLDKDFTGYLKIEDPSNSDKSYFLYLINNNIKAASLQLNEICFFGKKVKKRIKEILKNDETVIKAFSVSEEKLKKAIKNDILGKKEEFKIRDVSFPKGEYLLTVKNPLELKNSLKHFEIHGYGVSREKKAAIIIKNSEIIGGIYHDEYGTLKRGDAILDIKQSFPFDVFLTESNKLDKTSRTIKFKDKSNFWQIEEFQVTEVNKKKKIGELSLKIKKENDDEIEDAVIDILKNGKKISFGQTTEQGKMKKKLSYDTYKVWVKKEGYEPKNVEIKLNRDLKEKTIYLEKNKKTKLGLQVLTKDKKPVQEAKIELKRGMNEILKKETNDSGIIIEEIPFGFYDLLIEKEGIKTIKRIRIDEKEVEKEKNLKIILPVNYKELIRLLQETEKEKNILIENEKNKKGIGSRFKNFLRLRGEG